jgi:biotin carboxyl carrier protein
MKYKASINESEYEVELMNENFILNGKDGKWDLIPIGKNRFHIILNHQSFEAELVSQNHEEKIITLSINNNIYEVQLKDRYDELLHELGMDKVSSKKFNDLKSPMPGMVMKLEVQVGDEVKKGDALLVLEAMKMENLLKAQGSGKVKLIKVKAGDKVEKNERLILFE